MSLILIILSLVLVDPSTNRTGLNGGTRPKPVNSDWLTGSKLDAALNQPVIATWQNAELRTALRALSEQRSVAIILDRRLDPNHKFSLEASGDVLSDVLAKLAAEVDGKISVTGQTVYIGPINSVAKLRTLLTLRHEEVQELSVKWPSSRKSALTSLKTLRWDDLDSPVDIVQRLFQQRDPKLTLNGQALIPHDLWAASETPALSLTEALTLVLIQFDLTFQFDPTGTSIEIVAIPEKVAIERRFPLPKAKAEQISKAVRIEAPQIEAQATPEQLIAIGTQEQLEELERIIRSISSGNPTAKKVTRPAPLSKRRVTFQAKDVPLKAILDKLATTGIQFEYDPEKFKSQGVNLDQLIEIDVKDVKLSEMFDQILAPAGIAYEVEGLVVKLTALKAKN